MKSVVYICIGICTWMCLQDGLAQERTRQRPGSQPAQASGVPELSIRAQSKNDDQTRDVDNAPWLREIYRMVNLKEAANAPLYYPVEPIGDRMNLFTIIFKLFADNKLTVYEYLDGREIFTDAYKLEYNKETLNRFNILYSEQKAGAATLLQVDESDIPSGDVLSYLIKEAWYFDQANSTFDVKLLAICPMLVREGDFGDMTRTPMFWIPYENIRPYISRNPIMTSNVNNAVTYTIDDYFRKKMFKGEIIKTTNLLNHTLIQQVGDNPEALKLAQDSIEKQLKNFEEKLWMPKDTTTLADTGKEKGSAKKETRTRGRSVRQNDSKAKETKAEKPKKAKAEKSSSAPTRSVRRTR